MHGPVGRSSEVNSQRWGPKTTVSSSTGSSPVRSRMDMARVLSLLLLAGLLVSCSAAAAAPWDVNARRLAEPVVAWDNARTAGDRATMDRQATRIVTLCRGLALDEPAPA